MTASAPQAPTVNAAAAAAALAPDHITITRPDDWHLHLRDGAVLSDVVPHTAAQFGRAIVMPNLKPPVTSLALADAYKSRIVAAVPQGMSFEPLMTLYLTDNISPEAIVQAKAGGVLAAKLYPAGATTNSDMGVTSLRKIYPVLEAMQRCGMLLLVHGEVTSADIDLFDREAVFIEQQLIPLRQDFPELNIVFEHITTADAAQYVQACDAHVAATITAHHLLYNRNAIFTGGIRPHYYCLPVLKRETHRLALVQAATSGSAKFFLGTDSAPHPAHLKEHASGCAGCYTAHAAIELYATAFEQAGALDKLQGFASEHGPDFYRLPRNTTTVTLKRDTWLTPVALPFGDATIKPLAGGEPLHWRLQTQA
jgi:dihydroorotase